jgi:O-Antigen ligase
VRPAISARLSAGLGIVSIGILVAVATNMALTVFSSAKLAFALGGLALLIPTMVVKDPQAYWLFLLVMSLPFDITKFLSLSMVDSEALLKTYGAPVSGTIGLEIYLSDVILAAMLLPWLALVSLRRAPFYFPRIGYVFVLYLAWALLVSLVNAVSLYLSMFELCRQVLWFLFFVYLINNVSTRLQFRSIVLAVFLGFIISAATVVVFFERGIGTDTVAFAGLHDQPAATGSTRPYTTKKDSTPGIGTLTLHIDERGPGSLFHGGSEVKRSQGMFRHPAIPASLSGLVLPIVLAYLITAKNNRDRIFFFFVYALGFLALLLTFSRAGLIGFMVGTVAFFVIASWSSLISRRAFKLAVISLILIGVISIPLLVIYLWSRPESLVMRFYMFEAAIEGYASHPILGVGLNNGTAAMKGPRQELTDMGIPIGTAESADSYYLAILTEVGPLGSFLYFGFFANIAIIALGSMREVGVDLKPLLVGMVAGLAALATQSIADGPLAGHAVGGALWLFAALIVAIRHQRLAEARSSQAESAAAPVGMDYGFKYPALPGNQGS